MWQVEPTNPSTPTRDKCTTKKLTNKHVKSNEVHKRRVKPKWPLQSGQRACHNIKLQRLGKSTTSLVSNPESTTEDKSGPNACRANRPKHPNQRGGQLACQDKCTTKKWTKTCQDERATRKFTKGLSQTVHQKWTKGMARRARCQTLHKASCTPTREETLVRASNHHN